jgi:putative ABC transport system ATP-binding protein
MPVSPAAAMNGQKQLLSLWLGDRVHLRPTELSAVSSSGGYARALINDPAIVMADEPTGNLDSKSGDEIMELILNLNKEKGTTIIIVTHDPKIAQMTQRVIRLSDGMVVESDL